MNNRAIIPVSVSLNSGDFYTLWAPTWKENGSQWEAFLGDDENVLVFPTVAEMLVYLENTTKHDLRDHPKWKDFAELPEYRAHPEDRDHYDIVGLPHYLADRPSYDAVATSAKILSITKALGNVCADDDTMIFFSTHSVLNNVQRGADHYSGEHGLSEWSSVGRAVLTNWKKIESNLADSVRIVDVTEEFPSIDKTTIEDAEKRIASSKEQADQERAEREEKRKREAEAADPYDSSAWAAAGIDPIKITIDGKSVYTLRCYVDGAPVFLGRFGTINTFATSRQLLRWIIENDEHDLAKVSTWEDIVTAANAGELDVTVHRDNSYSFQGLTEDMEKGPEAVDVPQMSACYELLADAADWAGDDSINSYMLANPRFQDYLGYMLGSQQTSGYVPSKPYTDHSKGWRGLEDMLVKRFTKF